MYGAQSPSVSEDAPRPAAIAADASGVACAGREAVELAQATADFLSYLETYRGASPCTVIAYAGDLRLLLRFLSTNRLPTTVRDISTRHLQNWAVSMAGAAPATVVRRLNAASSLMAHLVRCGLLERNPVDAVVKPRQKEARPVVPSHDDCRRLMLAARGVQDKAMLLVLLTTGLRRAELLGLRMTDLAADATQVTVLGKGSRLRTIPIPTQTRCVLREYLAQRCTQSEFLFPNAAGNQISNTTFARWFARILMRAGLADRGLTAHKLRHLYARSLLQSQVDVKTVQELLGHRDLSTTCRYLGSSPEAKRAAAERLPEYCGDGATEAPCPIATLS